MTQLLVMASLFTLVLVVPTVASAQLLDRASSTVRGSSSSSSSSSSGASENSDDGFVSSASRTVRSSDTDRSRSRRSRNRRSARRNDGSRSASVFGGYVLGVSPYVEGQAGYSQPPIGPGGEVHEARTAVRVAMDLGYAIGGAVRPAVAARVSLPFMIDLTTRYSVFVEPTDNGLAAAALGRLGADWRVIDSRRAQLRVGVGVRHWHDAFGARFGADGLLGLDLFPGDPIILSGQFGVGNVGEAFVLLTRGTLGLIIESTEIFVGYHYEGLFADGAHVNLGGPMLGARLWL